MRNNRHSTLSCETCKSRFPFNHSSANMKKCVFCGSLKVKFIKHPSIGTQPNISLKDISKKDVSTKNLFYLNSSTNIKQAINN